MTDLVSKVKSIKDKVAIALKAVDDTRCPAAAGLDPTKVWNEAVKVCASGAAQIDALHWEELRKELLANGRENRDAVCEGVRKIQAKYGSR